MKNLWPSLGDLDDKLTPKNILEIQAENLNDITNGLLRGSIVSNFIQVGDRIDSEEFADKDTFFHIFNIYAPRLKYSFNLLSLSHEAMRLYPCSLHSAFSNINKNISDEENLTKELANIFSNENVMHAIKALMLQSKEKKKEKEKDDLGFADDLPF